MRFLGFQWVLVAVACGVIGCADPTGRSGAGPEQSLDTCDLRQSSCLEPKVDWMSLVLPAQVDMGPTDGAVDIGGVCHEGLFPSSRIEWEMTGPGCASATCQMPRSTQQTQGICDMGRASFRVALPAGVTLTKGAVYQVAASLVGRDSSGREHRNVFASARVSVCYDCAQ